MVHFLILAIRPIAFSFLICVALIGLLSEASTAQNPGEASIRVRPIGSVSPGRDATFSFEMDSPGKVNVVSFTFNFDPAVFTYVSSSLGADKPNSANLSVNDQRTAEGKFGILVDSAYPFAAGKAQIFTAIFSVSPNARPGSYSFSFGAVPTQQGVATTDRAMLNTQYEPGMVIVGSARKAIVGRVLGQDRTGLRRAKVTLKGPDGKEKTVITGSFGSFIFDDLQDGTYTVSVAGKGYNFTSKTTNLNGIYTELIFIAGL